MTIMFNEGQLDKVFQEISAKLESPVEGYLVGGLAMIKNQMKATTKDIDIVFATEEDARAFVEAAQEVGFKQDKELPPEYIEIGAFIVLKDEQERRIDVFVQILANKLMYTNEMKTRATELIFDDLTIHVSSINDIFLFKAVAPRPRDLDDMELLAKTGYIDWAVVEEEARNQPTPWKWIGMLFGRLIELEDKAEITAPITQSLRNEAEIAQGIELILGLLEDGPLPRDVIIKKFNEEDATFAKEVIGKMIEMGLIIDGEDELIRL